MFKPLKAHWLFYVTIAYIGGIALQAIIAPALLLPIACITITVWLCCAYIQNKQWLLYMTICATAFLAGSILYEKQSADHAYLQNLLHNKCQTITGTVTDIEKTPRSYLHTKITFKLHNNAPGKNIIVYTKKRSNLLISDIIAIHNVNLKKITKESFNTYLIKENALTTIFMPTLTYKLISRPNYSINRWLHTQKINLYNRLKQKMSKQNFALVARIFFGNKDASPYYMQQAKEGAKRWGTSHYLARSGLHLIIFILLLQYLLRFIPLPYIYKQILLMLFSILYFLFTWQSTAFNRAFATFLLYKVGNALYMQVDFLHLVTLVSLITLLINPIQLLFLDFQLSFGLTAGLALLNRATLYETT